MNTTWRSGQVGLTMDRPCIKSTTTEYNLTRSCHTQGRKCVRSCESIKVGYKTFIFFLMKTKSCGSISDSLFQSLTPWPNALIRSITGLSLKLWMMVGWNSDNEDDNNDGSDSNGNNSDGMVMVPITMVRSRIVVTETTTMMEAATMVVVVWRWWLECVF